MNRIVAVAEVVIRELIRRKDFYVLFVLTAAITLLMGSIGVPPCPTPTMCQCLSQSIK